MYLLKLLMIVFPFLVHQSTLAYFPTATSLRTLRNFRKLSTNRVCSMQKSLPPLIDVDCNLLHSDLKSISKNDDAKVGQILKEDAVQECNIRAMLSPSSTLEETRKSLDFLQEHDHGMIQLLTTAGVHPYDSDEAGEVETHYEELKQLIQDRRMHVAAIGECGLDASEGFPPLETQLPWFRAQVKLASELNLPLFVHERLAFDETIEILQNVEVPIIIHCFTGTREQCQQYVERGYSLSISGFIAKEPMGDEIRTCLEDNLIPLDRLMIETDAPYMGFPGCRSAWLEKQSDYLASLNGKKRKKLINNQYPNVPSSLPLVLDHVWTALNNGRQNRGMELLTKEELARATTLNAINFFGFNQEILDKTL
mmetsp:Transcript_14211/g.21002  ORF Transcript_14211/g.21002 Transcript_14211/m.21002 type:complete len:367 (+) Transcript_14211:104-1204(+)